MTLGSRSRPSDLLVWKPRFLIRSFLILKLASKTHFLNWLEPIKTHVQAVFDLGSTHCHRGHEKHSPYWGKAPNLWIKMIQGVLCKISGEEKKSLWVSWWGERLQQPGWSGAVSYRSVSGWHSCRNTGFQHRALASAWWTVTAVAQDPPAMAHARARTHTHTHTHTTPQGIFFLFFK